MFQKIFGAFVNYYGEDVVEKTGFWRVLVGKGVNLSIIQMENYSPDEVVDLLSRIYYLDNNPLKDTRGVSRTEFSRQYGIPNRTLQDWDYGNRNSPEYVKLLVDFTQFMN